MFNCSGGVLGYPPNSSWVLHWGINYHSLRTELVQRYKDTLLLLLLCMYTKCTSMSVRVWKCLLPEVFILPASKEQHKCHNYWRRNGNWHEWAREFVCFKLTNFNKTLCSLFQRLFRNGSLHLWLVSHPSYSAKFNCFWANQWTF